MKNKSSIVMFFTALLLLGAFSFLLVKGSYMMINAVPYVKAVKTIPPYTKITGDMVEIDYVAVKNAKPGMIKGAGNVITGVVKDAGNVIGQITKSEIPAGTPVYLGQLGYKGENTLTAQLTDMAETNQRGKSLPVENLMGLDGDLMVGDRVDVTGSLKLPLHGVQTPVSQTIAEKVMVLGIIRDANSNKMTGIKLAVTKQQGQDIDFVTGNGGKIGLMLCPYDVEDSVAVPTTPETFVNRHMVTANTDNQTVGTAEEKVAETTETE